MRHLEGTLRATEDYLALVENSLRETGGDIEAAVTRVKADQWDNQPVPKQPEQPYLINTRQRVEVIRKRMQKEGRL
jgi:hypothetical protein